MRDLTSIIADLIAAGATPEIIALAAEAHAVGIAKATTVPTAKQARNARYYERHKAELKAKRDADRATENALIKTIKADQGAVQPDQGGSDPASPAPSPDGRPSPPTPPHPTLNPSPTPDSQIGAGALGSDDQGREEGQPLELDLGVGRVDPEQPAEIRAKAAKPRMNDWPDDYFEQFWSAYPRKVVKKRAKKELERIYKSDNVPFFELMNGVNLLVRLGLDIEFVKYPDAWLRDERWNDEQKPRLNSQDTSTNCKNGMTMAAKSKMAWFEDSNAANERLREKANGQRNDHDAPAGPALDHEPRRQPGASAEPRSCQRPDAGRPGAAGGSSDGRRPAFASLPSRILGW